ncbi:transposase family protein [Mycolicibacterium austroafricanum]|uniref:Transposase family protein n=1 Tax=Mycolicibacterium austroafricanum TaxID=39687 RepID=A0ABT8H8L8_MYCAO|nr:transposase family protein [Mycolicibacterium austroafricanum]MBI5336552.1 transposase [Mycolicibacterium rufum]MDN4517105.1 transposase family protein [Mycolicibacterium austroafricanum]
MGLTLTERRAVTEMTAIRYVVVDKPAKSRILDELCANTGWHRSHARKALKAALQPKVVVPRRSPRPPVYGPDVIAALTACWLVLGMPAGKRLAPMLTELVAVLRHFDELVIDDGTAALLVSMSAATIDRRLAGERAKRQLKGRRATKPGSLLRSQIPIRTWADWDDAKPGFVEIDLVSHDGGNSIGPFAFTLTVTDIATGWTENRSVSSKEAKCVLRALESITETMPFPILGVDSDNGAEFINVYLFLWCRKREITFTRARPTNKNDGCHVEQKNWAVVRTLVGYHRYDTAPELLLLNDIWRLQSLLTNYFYPQQKLVKKVRDGAKVTKKYDTATTPFRRAMKHPTITEDRKMSMARSHALINPAATQRQIQALTAQLLKVTTSKSVTTTRARIPKRAQSHEATNPPSRAS